MFFYLMEAKKKKGKTVCACHGENNLPFLFVFNKTKEI